MSLMPKRGLARPVKRLLLWLEEWGLRLVIGLVALTALVVTWQSLIGCEGLSECANAAYDALSGDKDEKSFLDKLFGLFVTVAIGWAAVEVYFASLGLKIDAWLAPRICEHHLVIVAGRKSGQSPSDTGRQRGGELRSHAALAVEIAKSEASSGRWDVVLYLPGIDKETRRELWRRGVLVLQDELPAPDLLATAHASRARKLVAMRDDDDENVVLVSAALAQPVNPQSDGSEAVKAPGSGSGNLQCLMMIGPTDPGRSFSPDQLHRVRYFNEAELIARELLRTHPPDAQVATDNKRRVHVLLIGLGSVGRALVLRMGYLACYRSGLRARITIVEEPGAKNWKELERDHPRLDDVLQVRVIETGIKGLKADELASLQADAPLTMVYVCTKNEVFNLQCARILVEELDKSAKAQGAAPAPTVPIVVLDPPGGCVLKGLKQEPVFERRIELFSLVAAEAGAEAVDAEPVSPIRSVLEGLDDKRAEVLHDAYRYEEMERGKKDPGEWRLIQESHRASNRWAADHFDVKLRALGARLEERQEGDPAGGIDPEDLKLIAAMEHHRWVAEKVMGGIVLGRKTDGRSDRPTLVPTAYLTEEEFQKDMDQIVTLQNFHQAQGRRLMVTAKPRSTASEAAAAAAAASSQIAARLVQTLLAGGAADRPGPRHILLHGSGALAEQTIRALAHAAPEPGAPPCRITWVGKAAPAKAPGLAAEFGPELLDLRPVERPVEDKKAGIQADPAHVLRSEMPPHAILLCPDPDEELPGVIDSLAAGLGQASAKGVGMKILAVAWGPPHACKTASGYLGAADLEWVNAQEVLAEPGRAA